jgi:hypothetical protein
VEENQPEYPENRLRASTPLTNGSLPGATNEEATRHFIENSRLDPLTYPDGFDRKLEIFEHTLG